MTLPIRPAAEDDLDLLVDSWMQSYRGAGEVAGMGRDEYFAAIKPRILRLLRDVGGVVAYDPEDPGNVVGWACGNAQLLHYAYVRRAFRRQGIGRALVAALGSPKTFTHRSPSLGAFPAGMRFHPVSLLPEPGDSPCT